MFEDSPYTPVTAAIIAKPPLNDIPDNGPVEWLPVPPRPPMIPFEPKYKLISARERKLMHLRGESGSVSSTVSPSISQSVEETPVHPSTRSNRRCKDDSLMPATMTWTCTTPLTKIIKPDDGICDATPASVKRRTTDLIAATQPWASPAPPKAYSPLVGITDPRRQANDLIPATMPWVTPYITPSDRALLSENVLSTDHRRKKGIVEETFPKQSPSSVSVTPARLSRGPAAADDISRWRIRGVVSQDRQEEDFIKKLLSSNGIHVIKAKADIDIVSNTCNGSVEVLLRSADEENLKRVVEESGLFLQKF